MQPFIARVRAFFAPRFDASTGQRRRRTLPAVAAGVFGVKIVNGMSFGLCAVTIAPNASDMILGPDITGADNKYLRNTKATAKRGDFVQLDIGDADGYVVTRMRGTWARQA
jgi:hypothetical protein